MNVSPLEKIGRPATVLLVDDNEDHVLLTRLAMEEARLTVDLRVVGDGVECMEFLQRTGRHAGAPVPDLVLLDLHMPRMDGYEVMQRIQDDPALRLLPVVVLTTSADIVDVQRMHALGCNSYVVKPVNFESFVQITRDLGRWWFSLVVLPTATKVD